MAIAELAEAEEWTADASFDVIGTRPVRIGADGTGLVDEFLPLEVATVKVCPQFTCAIGAREWAGLVASVVELLSV